MQKKKCPFSFILSHGLPQPTLTLFLKKKKNKQPKKPTENTGKEKREHFWKLNGGPSSSQIRGVKSRCSAFWRVRKGV